MTFSAPLGIALVAIICLSSTITVKAQNYGIGSNIGLGPLGNFGSGFSFNPGPKLQKPNEESSSNAAHRGDNGGPGSAGAPTEGTTTPAGGYGINSNLGLGPLGSIGSGFNFFGKPKKEPSTTPPSQEHSSNAANRGGYGLNTNLGLGKAGSVGSGINYNKGGSTPGPAQTTTTQGGGYGINSNLGLGPLGSVGSGFNFFGKPKKEQATSPSQEPSDRGNIGVNSNLGLGKAGSVGSGFNFNKPGATAAPEQTATSQGNGVGINSNLGLGPAGNVGGGFNFQTPAKTAETTPASGLRAVDGFADSNDTSSTTTVETEIETTTTIASEIETTTTTATTTTTTVAKTEAPKWSNWTEWSPCTVSCGIGQEKRSRTCGDNDKTCFGHDKEQRACFNKPCPPGKWTEWSEWSNCTTTCGFGQQRRSRTCEGGSCFGFPEMQRPCPFKAC